MFIYLRENHTSLVALSHTSPHTIQTIECQDVVMYNIYDYFLPLSAYLYIGLRKSQDAMDSLLAPYLLTCSCQMFILSCSINKTIQECCELRLSDIIMLQEDSKLHRLHADLSGTIGFSYWCLLACESIYQTNKSALCILIDSPALELYFWVCAEL
jgi:hypothetical protein